MRSSASVCSTVWSGRDAEVEFKEPWFLEQRLALGYNLFYHNATYLSNYYNERNYGASVSLAKAFGQFWSGSITYTLQEFELYDFVAKLLAAVACNCGGREPTIRSRSPRPIPGAATAPSPST